MTDNRLNKMKRNDQNNHLFVMSGVYAPSSLKSRVCAAATCWPRIERENNVNRAYRAHADDDSAKGRAYKRYGRLGARA